MVKHSQKTARNLMIIQNDWISENWGGFTLLYSAFALENPENVEMRLSSYKAPFFGIVQLAM